MEHNEAVLVERLDEELLEEADEAAREEAAEKQTKIVGPEDPISTRQRAGAPWIAA
jgi:hypothetical protein